MDRRLGSARAVKALSSNASEPAGMSRP
jgi:hypothetical protein